MEKKSQGLSVLSLQSDDNDDLYLKPFLKIELTFEAFVQDTFFQRPRLLKL